MSFEEEDFGQEEFDAALELEASAELWRMAELGHKLDSNQVGMRSIIEASKTLKFTVNCSRRIGKTFLMVVLASMKGLSAPNMGIRFAAPAASTIERIVKPICIELYRDCPSDVLPHFAWHSNTIEFQNGSVITFAGCDAADSREKLRGPKSDLNIVEEAGSVPELHYVVNDILLPQTLTTGGQTILASSPPKSPGHEFVEIARQCMVTGSYIHRTIYDNPRITPETIEIYKQESGGEESTTWRREYLAQFVVDSESAVIPEWNADAEAAMVREVARPRFFDAYGALDIGIIDGCGQLFAYYDFAQAKLVIEDELLIRGQHTGIVSEEIRRKEESLWPLSMPYPTKEAKHAPKHRAWEPYLRIADGAGIGLMVIADLQALHGLTYVPTTKDDKELMVNELRQWVQNRQLIINPRCRQLIKQLQETVWNKQRNSYERNVDGHGELLDALVYLVRNVRKDRNPVPPGFGLDEDKQWIGSSINKNSATAQNLLKILKPRR